MPALESWDDDADFQGELFSPSAALTNISSRISVRSESILGEDDWHVPLAPNDATSTSKAITSANLVGIPIPQNVPSSALLGGAIKRLGKKKSRPNVADEWGDDFDIPMAGTGALKLRPSLASDAPAVPSTPATDLEEFDSEWAEGSLGIRFAGTRRDHRGRSSSVSAMSPSMGSCMTLESEDDDLGGLVLPTEPIDFTSRLKKRQASEYDPPTSAPVTQPAASNQQSSQAQKQTQHGEEDDMMAGLELDGGDLVDTKRRKINRNIKISQPQKPSAPAARTAATITFSDKPATSKIPRPAASTRNLRLDTVPESNSPAAQRTGNRLARQPPTTTGAQLLRSKRSAPVLGSRPTPAASRPQAPFLPAGGTTSRSQHVSAKSGSYHFRQPSDHHDRSQSPTHRSFSRMSGVHPTAESTPSRTGFRKDGTAASLLRQAANQRTLHVTKRRNFGDGSELDRFDDLPTSAQKESKFLKEPSTRAQPKTLRTTQSRRNLLSHDHSGTPIPSNASSASTVPTTPLAPPTPRGYFPKDNTPRFARDTAASRNAREQRLGTTSSRPRGSGPVEAVAINWKAQIAARSPQTSPSISRHKRTGEVKKPLLIKHMGPSSTKNEKGMVYNPTLQRWEGNEHALTKFENPSSSTLPLHPTHKDNHSRHHHTNSIPSTLALAPRDLNIPSRHGSPPRPALISQISSTRGVVVERGMVFDPQRMTWLKLDARALASDPMLLSSGLSPGSISVEEEDDPFAAIDDLVDETTAKITPGAGGIRTSSVSDKENTDWAVGEEFDLGPAFVRRQRAEEAEWRRRVERWLGPREVGEAWRWEIRRVAESYGGLR